MASGSRDKPEGKWGCHGLSGLTLTRSAGFGLLRRPLARRRALGNRGRAGVCEAVLTALLVFTIGGCAPFFPPRPPALPEAAVHVFLWGNVETTERDLRLAKEAGFTWVKQRFEWRNIERDGKGRFEWNEPDRILRAIDAAGLKVVARVDGHPGWARAVSIYPDDGPPDRLSDWTDYLSALSSRYRGRIHAYQIWNEPNLAREWGRRAPDAAEYTAFLRASYDAVKRADSQALVVSAGLSPTTDTSDNARPDAIYLREMYAAGARGAFDLLGAHGAGFKAAPEIDPAAVANDRALTNGDPSRAELRRAYAFRRVEDLRQIMVENGDGDRRVAILEMGWTSDPRANSPYRWHSVTEQQKGDYLARAFQYARTNWPWAAFMTVIYLPDPTWTADHEQLYWSITNRDGTPRDAYLVLKRGLKAGS